MYSYEDRMRAVKLYIKYDFSAADTIRELGYPNSKMIVRWYKEYRETGGLHRHYLNKHGRNHKKRPGHRSPETGKQGKSQPDRCPENDISPK